MDKKFIEKRKQDVKGMIVEPFDKKARELTISTIAKAKAFDIMKKHAVNDGWSNGWVIKFWEMNETELKKVNKCLGE